MCIYVLYMYVCIYLCMETGKPPVPAGHRSAFFRRPSCRVVSCMATVLIACAGSLLGEEVIGSIGFKVCEGHQAILTVLAGHVESRGALTVPLDVSVGRQLVC